MHANLNGAISHFFLLCIIIVLINTKDTLKAELIKFITNGMAILVGISLIMFILFFIGIPFPQTPLQDLKLGYNAINYYGFIMDIDIREYYRFKSIFAEPGHLSMGIIPLLYINKLNLKNKSVLVLFIAEIFTLSLAGYITLFSSIAIYLFSDKKTSRNARILILGTILISVYFFVKSDEDNIINKSIISRLQFDETKGTIAGYNRSKAYTDYSFDNFVKSSNFIYGIDQNSYSLVTVGSAGYKVYILRYGLLGIILVFLFYLFYAISYRNYLVLGLFVIFMMLLYQDSYPFWYAVIFSYILGISILQEKCEHFYPLFKSCNINSVIKNK
jgi:hypothetical protein